MHCWPRYLLWLLDSSPGLGNMLTARAEGPLYLPEPEMQQQEEQKQPESAHPINYPRPTSVCASKVCSAILPHPAATGWRMYNRPLPLQYRHARPWPRCVERQDPRP